MKREYFGMIFLVVSVLIIIAAKKIIGDEQVDNIISTYIIIFILIAYFMGQYSIKFPKSK